MSQKKQNDAPDTTHPAATAFHPFRLRSSISKAVIPERRISGGTPRKMIQMNRNRHSSSLQEIEKPSA